ncbi:MAG TPA: ATP-binding cassette domain-containing protein [Burkholderiales bacterium]|nr:ATP-binding cassette domain-containing protein [Burkholderiales bacterium]
MSSSQDAAAALPDSPTIAAAAPNAASTTLLATGLSRRFGPHVAVNGIDLELRRGEVVGFLGPNGAGKTTTMQMLTGNLAPSAGAISICGIDLFERPAAAKMHIGYLPETPPLYRDLTVNEYLRLAVRLRRVPRSARAGAVAAARERCGLDAVGDKLIATLSKGYQQRVGIAQAIVHRPDVVILDEPTVGLDPNQILEIRGLIRELGGAHSVILSTHILPEVESVCDRVQIMHHGNLVFSDTITGLRRFHGGGGLLLGLRQPPAEDVLRAIGGVADVSRAADTLFRIAVTDNADPTDELVASAVRNGWGLYQLSPAQTSLEDVFVNLTTREAS